MKPFVNKKLAAGVTGLAVLVGGAGAAMAATEGSTTQSSNPSGSQAFISDLAGRLNVTSTALVAAVKAAETDQINAAVAAGRLTQAQGTAAEQRIAQSTGVSFGGWLARGARGGFSGARGEIEATAAQYLGISESTLRSDLKAGQSLASIATSTAGKSVAGLTSAIIAAETTRLDSAVASGQITQAQETQRLANLSSRVDAIVQRTWTAGSKGWSAHNGGRTRSS
jgi:hypothetical protein